MHESMTSQKIKKLGAGGELGGGAKTFGEGACPPPLATGLRVSMLNQYISSTACELMLILSISITFNVTCLTVASLIMKSCQQR